MYCVDTNVFMDWWERLYPDPIFPGIKTRVDALIAAGRWCSVERVYTEIIHVGGAPLNAWAQVQVAQFLPHDAELLNAANAISATYPGLIDPNAHHDEADRYLIALAQLRGLTVVTHETTAASKKRALRPLFIPDVCRAMNLPCINLLEVMRREQWSLT